MAQTTSVMNLVLDTAESGNTTFHGSVISAAPDATTYFVTRMPDADCTECENLLPGRTYINGPSTFARHITEVDMITWDTECNIRGEYADCEVTVAGPSAAFETYDTGVFVGLTDSLTPVTITAGLDKILAAGTVTGAVSTATSGTAQTAEPASSGASETGASAPATSSSNSASTPSSIASGAATGAGLNVVLAAFCGVSALMLEM